MKDNAIQKFFGLVWSFPNSAERIVSTMAKSGQHAISTEFVERSAGLNSHEIVHVSQILLAMMEAGFIREVDKGLWISNISNEEMLSIAIQLKGAVNFKIAYHDSDIVQLVITMPEAPSKLSDVLPEQGPYYAKIGETNSVFAKIAHEAKFRLAIVTPFIDRYGAEWILNMFKLTECNQIERILIIRDFLSAKAVINKINAELRKLEVKIYDYFIHHEGRQPPYETFHAKLILGDDIQAYIGSANMLASSLELALELGVLVKGRSVEDVIRLVDSIRLIAKPIENY